MSGPDRKGLHRLSPNAPFDRENRLPGFRSELQPKPEIGKMRAVLQIDIENGDFRGGRWGKTVARNGLRREDPRQSAADVFGTLGRVGDDGKSIHIQARDRNSIDFTMPGLTNWALD